MALQRAMQETVDEVHRRLRGGGHRRRHLKHGVLAVARNPAQQARLEADAAEDRAGCPTRRRDLVALDAARCAGRVHVEGALGGACTPHAARVQPAKLVQGLAAAVERLGVADPRGHAGAPASSPGSVRHRARHRPRAATSCAASRASPRASRASGGRWLPLNSAMIVTEPLPDAVWAGHRLGRRANCSATARTPTCTPSARPTAASRSAAAASRTATARAPTATAARRTPTIAQLVGILRDLFPRRRATPASTTPGAASSASRATGAPTVTLDRATGLGRAGGYVGNGVATTNLAGRTLRDLVLGAGHDRARRLPWVGQRRAALGARAAAVGSARGSCTGSTARPTGARWSAAGRRAAAWPASPR